MVKVRKCDNTRRRKYSAANLEEAIELVQLKKISVRKAAKLTKVPSSTIQDYIGRGKISEPETVIQQKLERQTALTKKEEKVLIDLLLVTARWGFPLKLDDICNLVHQFLNSTPKKNTSI